MEETGPGNFVELLLHWRLSVERDTEIIHDIHAVNYIINSLKQSNYSSSDLLKLGTRPKPDQLGLGQIELQASWGAPLMNVDSTALEVIADGLCIVDWCWCNQLPFTGVELMADLVMTDELS